MEVFDGSDKVGADVVRLHGCLQSCMPNPVEGLLEVSEDMVEVLLVLERLPVSEYSYSSWCSDRRHSKKGTYGLTHRSVEEERGRSLSQSLSS